MTRPADNAKIRAAIIFAVLIAIFLTVGLRSEKRIDARRRDYANYWQAGHMILAGQDVYNAQVWTAERSLHQTALHSETTFQYPLPFAIFMAPLSLLDVGRAFTLWILFEEISILISIFVLFTFYPKRSMFFELLALATIYLFRPTLIVVSSGQIVAVILLVVTLAAYLFSREKWLYGGMIASLAALKPSLGVPFLILTGIWLLSKKRWTALIGMAAGAVLLYGVGALYNSHWAVDYLAVGRYNFDRYYGRQTTLWGVTGLLFKNSQWNIAAGVAGACLVLAVTGYFLAGKNIKDDPFRVMAVCVSTTLLVAPYSWAYEQLLLTLPIIYILIVLATCHGEKKTALFSLFIVIFAVALALIARTQGHDVWSVLISGSVWSALLWLPGFHPVSGADNALMNP
jgi:hypothetical protein